MKGSVILMNTSDLFADLFPPVPQKFLELLFEYCDENNPAASIVCGGTYLKRLSELDVLDLDGFCDKLNYIFFTGIAVLYPDLFGTYNVNEIVEFIKEKSVLGSILKETL